MKKCLLFLVPAALIMGCNDGTEKADKTASAEIKQYSIEQFYKSTNVGGGAFSSDDTKLLVSSNEAAFTMSTKSILKRVTAVP